MSKETFLQYSKHLPFLRRCIVEDYREGLDYEEIAVKYGYHIKSVKRIVRKFGEKRNFKRSKGAGRPPSLSRADKISIRNCARANRYYSRIEIKNHLHLQVSCETIRQYLHYLGYSYKYPRKKQKLTQANKTERVNWATF